ncbi:MAG TPA: hypothetical protein VFX51_09825, partial [Solirubrobacteraceae bacterium]|nr:hypothetical protein [Solirubrobacteraceae bacterium]
MALSHALAPTVVIRAARGSDGESLRRLAALDSARIPAGDILVAEAEGAVVAAHSPTTGATIADPFRRTADVVEAVALAVAGAPGAEGDREVDVARAHGGQRVLRLHQRHGELDRGM